MNKPHGAWIARCLGDGTVSPLGEHDVELLVDSMSEIRAAAGTTLFTRDSDNDDIYVVEAGKVALTRPNLDRTPFLQVLEPGDIFGDVGVLLDRVAPVDAIVLEDVELLTMPAVRLLELLRTRPRIAMRWMVSLAGRLADTQDRLEQLLAGPLDLQIAALLGHIANDDGVVSASQQTIAQLLGTQRPSVSRSLKNLETRGLIDKSYRTIQIIDPEGLALLTA